MSRAMGAAAVAQDDGPGWMLSQNSRLEENQAMGEREQVPGNSARNQATILAQRTRRDAALMREILRAQEQHREGGIEPEPDETSNDPQPAT